MIAGGLVRVSEREFSQGLVELVGAAGVTRKGNRITGAGMGLGQDFPTNRRVVGQRRSFQFVRIYGGFVVGEWRTR